MATSTTHALKEWAVTIAALREGRQILLLRKGGIHEPHGGFKVAHGEFVFFPGLEHQKADLLKPEEAARYAHLLGAGDEAGPLRIDTCAQLVDAIALDDPARAFRIATQHIWSESYVRMRVEYKPERPLYVFFLRVFALPEAVKLPRLDRYAGCRSWVELGEEVSTGDARPVLDDKAFEARAREVRSLATAPR